MDVDQMLEHRDTVYLSWVDPWEALDLELKVFTACVHHRATVHDCIGIARERAARLGYPPYPNDREALLDFIAIMWAEPVVTSPVECGDSPCVQS